MKSTSDSVPIPDVGVSHRLPYDDMVKFLTPRRGFTNTSNYNPLKVFRTWLPSRTVPDMSPSLRDMLNRHLNGGSVKTFLSANVPVGSNVIPDNLERLDALDRADLAERNADFIATTRGRMQTARAAREQSELFAKATAAAEARILSRKSIVGDSPVSE